ncbi:MAG: metal ABC transporter ATP-binding protein [Acidilobaceae archaeon]|nr:metal ABC transporter ATP-binding protein [Acidilobaceae archaeon]MCX8166128.1 metal ABC transporter ATP-binding protein [Acidilobaceae archaeon]MDW7974771.1 metal ABC transporter ATP-binding protein [Sulfolobales archaeon]
MSLEVAGLSVSYGEAKALEDVTFSLQHPSSLVIVGPNGAGKTTLLKALLGMVDYEGKLRVFGLEPRRDSQKLRQLVSYLPQASSVNQLVPLKVRDIVYSPQELAGESREAAERAIEITDIGGLLERRFSELSGGQKQRVLIARALAKRAKMLLLDEPFSMVDVGGREQIAELLLEAQRREEITLVIVSHDLSYFLKREPYVALLNKRLIAFGRAREALTLENLAKAYGLARLGEVYLAGEEHGPY